jgi:hypothetical protein
MATATPAARRGPDGAEAAHRVAQAGRATIRRQNPSSRERGTEGLCLGAASLHSGTYAASGPNREPGRILIPGDGAAGDQEAQNRPACPAMAARDACGLFVSTTSWRYGLRRTCRLVTGRSHRPRSTWPSQARLAPLAVTHRYNRTHCLWLEQFQILPAESGQCEYAFNLISNCTQISQFCTLTNGRLFSSWYWQESHIRLLRILSELDRMTTGKRTALIAHFRMRA